MSELPATQESEQMDRLDFAMALRSYHHNGIWEEQKHFTWLISLVLSVELLALSTAGLNGMTRDVVTLTVSVVGLILTFIAIRIQRLEGGYFAHANDLFVYEFNQKFPDRKIPIAGPAGPSVEPLRRRAWRTLRGRGGVRDHFELLFVLFGVVFAGLAVHAATSRIF